MLKSFKNAFTLAEGASHGAIFANGRKSAFTLAEVLITLGIIGVVAAMTMPTLMNSTNGAQYRTAYKKALSVLSQAVVLNVALDDYDLSQTSETGTDTTKAGLYSLFMNRMNVVKTGTSESWAASNNSNAKFGGSATSNYTLYFNDGITFTFANSEKACTAGNATATGHYCKGVIDVNGAKNPNKQVTCDGTGNTPETAVSNCQVTNPTDIYPVIMYDQSILPNSDAARAVLYGGK